MKTIEEAAREVGEITPEKFREVAEEIVKSPACIELLNGALLAPNPSELLVYLGIRIGQAMMAEAPAPEGLYYIRNRGPVGNCVQWWAEGKCGYTCDLNRAHKFTRKEALSICEERPEIDSAYACHLVDALSLRHVDIQMLRDVPEDHPGVRRKPRRESRPAKRKAVG